MVKVPVYLIDGSKKADIELPAVFNETVRKDLIQRAFLSELSIYLQPKGAYVWAGMQTTAKYVGRKESYHALKNRGIARLPRELYPKGRIGRVRRVPSAVTGRRAHPPKAEKVLIERMNKKEKEKAIRSAIAATSKTELAKERGHIAPDVLPIIVDEKFEEIKKTKEVLAALKKLGIEKDLQRSVKGRKPRGGRKGGKRVPRSVLIITSDEKPILKSAKNIPGVDVMQVSNIDVIRLAPGGVPGRLTIWSEKALQELK